VFAAVAISLLPLSACTGEALLEPTTTREIPATSGTIAGSMAVGTITDLKVTKNTAVGLTLRWTQVADGTGNPASYRVRYTKGTAFGYSSATLGCEKEGIKVGTGMFCYVGDLQPGTRYTFQVGAYRVVDGTWGSVQLSNVITPRTISQVGTVDDLSVTTIREHAMTVRWKQVGDGTGNPARYQVRVSRTPIRFDDADIACDKEGTGIGAFMWCYVGGLDASTTYDVQLSPYREKNGYWVASTRSNVVTASTAGPTTLELSASKGIWLNRTEILKIATKGSAWDMVLADAAADPGTADISHQDSNHDVYTLAAALVCARTRAYCDKALTAIMSARGTEVGARWLDVGRNLGAYVIAADLIGLHADADPDSPGSRFERWVESWLTKRLPDHVTGDLRTFQPFSSGSNDSAQEGLAYTAVAAYLGDNTALKRAWDAYRAFACDPTAPSSLSIDVSKTVEFGWAHDNASPCAINPKGSKKTVPAGLPGAGGTYRLDGSVGNDMRRGGRFKWTPGYTQYPWVGLEGFIPTAVLLERAGYPAFSVADNAVLRTIQYLWHLRNNTGDTRWFDGVRSRELVSLVNVAYGRSFLIKEPVGGGRTIGYTAWSHAKPTLLGLSGTIE
jgi:hypothetical protein